MLNKRILKYYTILQSLLCSASLHASFIEQTLGAAVVNDATAVYFNPAALTVLSQKQFILLGTVARMQTNFNGSAQRIPLNLTETGSTTSTSNFYLPSFYLGLPLNNAWAAGFSVVINDFTQGPDSHSILRYAQSPNHTYDMDLVPALSVKLNKFLSLGGNINFSQAHFVQKPLSGIPSLVTSESRSNNDSRGSGLGWDVGLLIEANKSTKLGFNYRSAITYSLQGSSTLNGISTISSNNYAFDYWTPARSVLSLSHFLTEQFGLIATVQYLQWDIFKEANIRNFATQIGTTAVIIPQATIPYHFHNSWMMTLGTLHNLSPKWIVRFAGTFSQAPSNGQFQIDSGDSYTVGFSMGYKISENLALDGSYAHGFFNNQKITIQTTQNTINGINKSSNDGVSLKLTATV